MRHQKESFGQILLKSPWWVSVTLGVVVFIAMRWIVPAHMQANQAEQIFAGAIVRLSPIPLVLFALIALGSFMFAKKRHRLVDEQTSLEKLRETGWKDFEYLVAEAFRRQGYAVDYSLGRGADGGVDITLQKDGRKSLVQCKQWKVFSVGAPVIREMFGLMTAERADESIIVTTGKFTRDAQSFAKGKPIKLVDGPMLLALVQSVQLRPEAKPSVEIKTAATKAPACPTCGLEMMLRTSRRGTNAGNQFWGCPSYPSCKGTRKFQQLVDA